MVVLRKEGVFDMANGRNGLRKIDSGRDAGGFVAMPWSVLDCPAYASLSHPARSLLMEIARQCLQDNNGRLLASAAHLSKRGWKSSDVITRAKRDLMEAGFIHETVKGHRPNRASWYAVTWRAIDRLKGYDHGAVESFERGAYRKHDHLKIATLKPPRGIKLPSVAISHGEVSRSLTSPHGAVQSIIDHLSTPCHGNHLEIPSDSRLVNQ